MIRRLAALLLLLASPAAAQDTTEAPPDFDPAELLGARATGPNYTVAAPVRSDGLLRLYTLETPYGRFAVSGDGMLETRLAELAALARLEGLNEQQVFVDGLKEAAEAPVDFVKGAIDDPAAAARDTISGVGRLFGRVRTGVEKALAGQGGDPGRVAADVLGRAKARRELAVGLGVDPYTDFPPLDAKLDQVAMVSAAGSLTVGGALALVPGGAAAAAGGLRVAGDLSQMVLSSTATELDQATRQRLAALAVERPVIDAFLANTRFTPVDRAIMAGLLEDLKGVGGRDWFLSRAAAARTPDEAHFQIRHAALAADYHARVAPLAGFVGIGGLPFLQRQDRRILALFPLDALAWTDRAAGALTAIDADLKKFGVADGVELRITGTATPTAKAMLIASGWSVTEDVEMPAGAVR